MMADSESVAGPEDGSIEEFRARAEDLEQRMTVLQKDADARVIRAELKVAAVRAGMIDLDGLKLMDLAPLVLDEHGELPAASHLIAQLKHAKPWLFGGASTSSSAGIPPAQSPRPKLATEMTDEEYREARSAMLRRYS